MKTSYKKVHLGICAFLVFLSSAMLGPLGLRAQNRIIVNRSFETGSGIPHNDVAYLASQSNPNPQIDGWYSTHPPYNGVNFPIEHWHTGFQGVSSQQGTYHVELNVTQSSRLYQIVYLVHGEIFHWEYFHRQRISGATETVQYSIYSQDGSTNLFIIDTHTSTNNTGWDQRSGNYTFNGASGIYQIGFESTTGGGSGNFLDNISIGLDALTEFTRMTATVFENNSAFRPYIKLNGEVATASSITFQVTSTNAVEGVDYTFTNKIKQIAVGQYSLSDSIPLDLVILNNPASNGARSLKLTVSGVTGDVEFKDSDGNGFDSTLTITILENYAPGGIFGSQLWLRADAGTSTAASGANVSSWLSQEGHNFNFSQATANKKPVFLTGAINFNPALQFNGNTSGDNDWLS